MNTRLTRLMVFIPLFVVSLALTAHAQLSVGPVDPATGFPQWYRDATKPVTRLEICLDQTFCEFARPRQGNPFSQRIGFGNSASFYNLQADIGRLASLELGIQAFFPGGRVANGNQRVRNFIRIELRNLPRPGAYRVIHPFGNETFNAVRDPRNGRIEVNFVRSVTGANFRAALNGPVTRFLRARTFPPGFIGDSSTPTVISGSPTRRNLFQVIGPAGTNLGGPARQPNVATTRLFKVMGQRFQ
jgi:hypothetical protein